MNTALYIARKFLNQGEKKKSTSRPVVTIAITGISLGIMAMLLSVMVVTGFRNEISEKVTGFMAHIRVSNFDTNNSFEESPLSATTELLDTLRSLSSVKHVQSYAYKACILKAKDDIQGAVLKGVTKDFDWTFFKSKLVEGSLPQFSDSTSNTVLLSQNLARKLQLKTGDSFLVFFIQKDRKVRKLKIAGIYNTGLGDDFDNLYLLCDINLIRQVNNWKPNQVGGIELFLNDFDKTDEEASKIYYMIGNKYNTQTVTEMNPQIFNWLELQNLNVIVIISLIILVAMITMISTLLILVLENSRQIGLLKAMGGSDGLISKTFFYVAINILIKGLIIGNLIGIAIALIQKNTGILKLPEESYYISSVPVNFTISGIVLINLLILLICFPIILIPSRMIAGIQPIKVIRFE